LGVALRLPVPGFLLLATGLLLAAALLLPLAGLRAVATLGLRT
jgi:hypothetical protein